MILNKILLGGRMATDPELRVTGRGTSVAHAYVAFNPAPYYDTNGQKRESEAVFVSIERWGKGAETLSSRFKKGDAVFVEGEVISDKWHDKQLDIDRQTLKVKVIRMQRSGVTNLNFCRVTISGNLTRDPQLKSPKAGSKSDKSLCIVDIAHNGFPYEVNGEKRQPEPVFVSAICFGDDAENTAKYCTKGNTVLIEGTLYTNTYRPEGASKDVKSLRMSIQHGGIRFLKRQTEKASDGTDDTVSDSSPLPEERRSQQPVGAGSARPAVENLDEDVPF